MTSSLLLALTAADTATGTPSGDAPACLLPVDGASIVERLLGQLSAHGTVAIVTWPRWEAELRAAVGAGVEVATATSHADALRWVARHLEPRTDPEPPAAAVVVLHAHLVADDLAVGRIADAAAGGTSTLVAPPGGDDGVPLRVTRGRVVAAGSAYHRVRHPSARSLHAVRIGSAARDVAREHAAVLAELVDDGPPPAWAAEAGSRQPAATHGRPAVDPEDDLAALLLVAIVRGGQPVAGISLPSGSVWTHPRTAGRAAEAADAVRSVDVEQLRLRTAVKADDGFFTTFFVSTYSRYWARWAARRGFTPNQVTTASMALGVAAAAAFGVGTRWWALAGAILLQLAFTLDCVDGQLARYSRRFSALGAWLDSIFDRGKEYVVLAGLAVGGVRAGDDAGLWLLAGAVLALQTFRHTLDFGYAEQQRADAAAGVEQPLLPVVDNEPSFWEPVSAAVSAPPSAVGAPARSPAALPSPGDAAGSTSVRSLARGAIGSLRRAEGVGWLRWAKRVVVLPIGERFLLISVLAVVATPRIVFLALLVWGGLATLYTLGGRLIRSVA